MQKTTKTNKLAADLTPGDRIVSQTEGTIYEVRDAKQIAGGLLEAIVTIEYKGDVLGQSVRVMAMTETVTVEQKVSPSKVTGPADFWAESIVQMKPRAEIEKWLSGAATTCIVCGIETKEGDDCAYDKNPVGGEGGHYWALGEKVQALLEESLKEVN